MQFICSILVNDIIAMCDRDDTGTIATNEKRGIINTDYVKQGTTTYEEKTTAALCVLRGVQTLNVTTIP